MLATAELICETAQPARLAEVLPRFLSGTPLYQRTWQALRGQVPTTAADLARLPLITKKDIRRDFPNNFLGQDGDLEALVESETIELEHTSGTSEQRTALLLPRRWWAEQEKRALELNAAAAQLLATNPETRRVTISSPVCSSEICYTGVPSREERTIGNTLFVSLSRLPFLWSQAELKRIADEAIDWKPRFLDVDPVYGVVFARYCQAAGVRLPSLKFIICSYEYVSVVHRRILERAFGVPVYDLYGSTETGHLLMEDVSGQMRPSLETAVLEVIEGDDRGIGELVVTTLTNEIMPLIRYRIGDLVERSEEPYGTRYCLHGRVADAFMQRSGRRVTTREVDQCFAGISGIAHYQLSESSSGRWLLRFVPDQEGPTAGDQKRLQCRLVELLSCEDNLALEATDLLMPESSGKFRLGYPARAL